MKNTNYSVKKSVKKYQSYGILLLALLFCSSVRAEFRHYVGGFGQVGEWSLMPSSSSYSSSLGVAGGLGFAYELQAGRKYKPFRLLFDLGVCATYGTTSYNKTTNAVVPMLNQKDLNGIKFDYIYDISDRKDKYTDLAVHVPVLIGVQYRRFYALAGVKVYAHMWTQTKSTALLTTFGQYWTDDTRKTKLYDDFYNMPQYQFFSDEKVKKSKTTSLNLDMDLSLEIGARLGVINYAVGYDVPKRLLEYRIGAFLDYGLLDVHTNGTLQALDLPDRYDINPNSRNYVLNSRSMIDNVQMNDVMATDGFAKKVQNLVVGVKFTILFQLPEEQKCVMCDDGYKSTAVRASSSRGMQYEE